MPGTALREKLHEGKTAPALWEVACSFHCPASTWIERISFLLSLSHLLRPKTGLFQKSLRPPLLSSCTFKNQTRWRSSFWGLLWSALICYYQYSLRIQIVGLWAVVADYFIGPNSSYCPISTLLSLDFTVSLSKKESISLSPEPGLSHVTRGG